MFLIPRVERAVLVAALVFGCARGGDDAGAASETQAVAGDLGDTARAAPTPAPSVRAEEPLSASDLDAYVRGVQAEIDTVEHAWVQLRKAKTGTDTLSALFAATPDNTQPVGASRSGLSLDRYRVVVDRVDGVLATRDMGAAWAKQQAQMDTTTLDSATRARVRQSFAEAESAWGNPYKGLAPDVADAIKRRSVELDTLRSRLMRLRLGGGRKP
jgi:predicted nucleic acid-binding Zn ribbon protein